MSNVQEIGRKVRGQTLDSVRQTQDAVIEAVTVWTETVSKITGYSELAKQFPAATEIIDSNFDFAEQILESQRDFASRVVAATAPKTRTSAPKATRTSAPKAIESSAPTAAKKSAARKTATTAKKSSAVQALPKRTKSQ